MTENDEKLYCMGCGAQIQTEDKDKPGYVQASTLKKYLEDDGDEEKELFVRDVSVFVITMKSLMLMCQMTTF